MTSLKHKQQGFTIVELLIVIIVIVILAVLVVTTFSGVHQKARNTERATDIKFISGQVEAYYASNDKYPTLANMNDANWRASNMKALDNDILKDPKGASATLADKPAANVYSYVPSPTGCDNGATDCNGYTLTATNEGGGTTVKTNLN